MSRRSELASAVPQVRVTLRRLVRVVARAARAVAFAPGRVGWMARAAVPQVEVASAVLRASGGVVRPALGGVCRPSWSAA